MLSNVDTFTNDKVKELEAIISDLREKPHVIEIIK